MEKSKDIRIVEHIIEYCDRITEYISTGNTTYESFSGNKMLADAVCLCVLQIGELSTVLTDDYKSSASNIPWRQIKQVRNIIAHHYGTVDSELLWEIVSKDIPDLRVKCQELLAAAVEQELEI